LPRTPFWIIPPRLSVSLNFEHDGQPRHDGFLFDFCTQALTLKFRVVSIQPTILAFVPMLMRNVRLSKNLYSKEFT